MRTIAFAATGMLLTTICAGPARADGSLDYVYAALRAAAQAAQAALQAAQAADARRDYATEFKLLRPLAEQGMAAAQGSLGFMYADGRGVPTDDVEAVRWYRLAAGQGDAVAQTRLGIMYKNGRGVPEDFAEAAHWYRIAAEQGNLLAQNNLGFIYKNGQAVAKDFAQAARWYRSAAERGYAAAQYNLGDLYEHGEGVPKDYVQAYMWLNLAVAGGINRAAQDRDSLEHSMTGPQTAKAQQLTAEFQPVKPAGQQPSPQKVLGSALDAPIKAPVGQEEIIWQTLKPGQFIEVIDPDTGRPVLFQKPQPAQLPQEPKQEPEQEAKQEPPPHYFGTGFFIGEGVLLTNAHVVEGCSAVTVGLSGRTLTAQVIARDVINDLAVLRSAANPPAVAVIRLYVRQGEWVAAYGYPLAGLLSSGGNLTTGNINSLSGLGDDSRFLQISAPVQPGNSGGPLFDDGGNVIGIVTGKLNAGEVAKDIGGDIPQNVNFAIKASVAAAFLDSNGINYTRVEAVPARSPADIAEKARRFTVPVECVPPAHS